MEFKERLTYLRNNKGWTKKQTAEKIGISLGAYANYEYGNREPNQEITKKIASTFDVSVQYLLTGKDFNLENFVDLDKKYSMTANEEAEAIAKIEEMINRTSHSAKKDILTKVKNIDQFERFDLISLNKIMDLFIMFKDTPAVSTGFLELAYFIALTKDDLENPSSESLNEQEIIEHCQKYITRMIESITKEKDNSK